MDKKNSVDTLQWLGFYLRGVLENHLPEGRSVTVQGAVNAGGLLFLMQHGEALQVNDSQVFRLAQTAFQQLPLNQFEYRDQHIYEVRLYLRVQGQRQPYAAHRFGLELPERSQSMANQSQQGNLNQLDRLQATHDYKMNEALNGSRNGASSRAPVSAPSPVESGDRKRSQPHQTPQEARGHGSSPNGHGSAYSGSVIPVIRDLLSPEQNQQHGLSQTSSGLEHGRQVLQANQSATATIAPPVLQPDSEQGFSDEAAIGEEPATWPSRKALLVGTGAMAGVCAAIGASYVLSRPCVVGGCPAIVNAQDLDRALQDTQTPWSIQHTEQVKTEMGSAIQSLERIPIWSHHYETAQTLLADYRAQEVALENLLNAYRLANQAAQQSLNPPHPVETWAEIVGLWQAAIAQLEGISASSAIYPLALEKLQEYRQNLAIAMRYQALENTASDRFNQAQRAAGVAEAREGVAQNVENWRLVRSTWQVAVDKLSAVPTGTVIHRKAAGLLPVYQARLAAARDRLTREQLAANTYSQAITAAGQARNYEQQSQWQSAVEKWQQASAYVQQVGQGTFYYDQAQALTPTYQASLQEATGRLTSASQLAQTHQELAEICEGFPQVCQFTVGASLISVRLTTAYFQQVQAAQRNLGTQPQLSQHLQGLQTALVIVSNNANLPLELYGPDSQLIGRYVPLPFGAESAKTLIQAVPQIGNDR